MLAWEMPAVSRRWCDVEVVMDADTWWYCQSRLQRRTQCLTDVDDVLCCEKGRETGGLTDIIYAVQVICAPLDALYDDAGSRDMLPGFFRVASRREGC